MIRYIFAALLLLWAVQTVSLAVAMWRAERTLRRPPLAPIPPTPPGPDIERTQVCTQDGVRTAIVYADTRDAELTGIMAALEMEGFALLRTEKRWK